ncbi:MULTISPECIES: hypothetical protein [Clostridium]|uniref:hypothetical protein n=1 Tax=Clostridium TaxID=1485 RepID=UPI0008267B33|nr:MULTISPECIES: hypothetical protein [Clostridium]PJI08232.1 hypothetical protein CUB90_10300 [Clostridium sp. CT7]
MRIFQTCFFIIGIIFWLLIGLVIALIPGRLDTKKDAAKEKHKYNYLQSLPKRKIWWTSRISPWKAIWFIIVMGITIYLLKPNFLDLPQLITGKLSYVTEEVVEIRHYRKDLTEYVYLSTGEEVKFFFSSGVSENNLYKIGYLTHTHKAIYCEKIDFDSNDEEVGKVVGFPFKDILTVIAVLGVIAFLVFISPYIRFKVFIPTNIIAIPAFAYYFIKCGMQNGIWFSVKNEGIFGLIMGIVYSFMIFFMYLLKKRKSDDLDAIYFFAQLFSICELGLLICVVFNLN